MDMRPALPVAAESDTTRVRIEDGTPVAAVNMTFTPYDIGRIRAGYVCIRCLEAQKESFPRECWVCKFPIRDEQLRVFGEEYDGPATIGPAKSIEELRLEDAEAKARARHEQEKPTSRIWVPRGV